MSESNPSAFGMVITDMAMPGMTGDQLVASIHRIRPTLPVILCPGNPERLSKEKAGRLGIGEVLEKPVTLPRLATAIRQVIDGKPGKNVAD